MCQDANEVVETEVLDLCPFEQILKTPFHALPSTGRPGLRRKDSIFTNHGGKPPQFAGKFDGHRDVPHLASLQLRPHRQQLFAVHHVRPSQAENFCRAHPRCDGNEHDQPETIERPVDFPRTLAVRPWIRPAGLSISS